MVFHRNILVFSSVSRSTDAIDTRRLGRNRASAAQDRGAKMEASVDTGGYHWPL